MPCILQFRQSEKLHTSAAQSVSSIGMSSVACSRDAPIICVTHTLGGIEMNTLRA